MKNKVSLFILIFIIVFLNYKNILNHIAEQLTVVNITDFKKNYEVIIYIPSISSCRYDELKYLYNNKYSENIIIIKPFISSEEIERDALHSIEKIVANYIGKDSINITTIKFKIKKNDGFYVQRRVFEYINQKNYKKVLIVEAPYFVKATKYIFDKLNEKQKVKIDIYSSIDKEIINNWWSNEKGLIFFFNALYSALQVKISLLAGKI